MTVGRTAVRMTWRATVGALQRVVEARDVVEVQGERSGVATGRRRFYPPGATSLDVSETLAARGK